MRPERSCPRSRYEGTGSATDSADDASRLGRALAGRPPAKVSQQLGTEPGEVDLVRCRQRVDSRCGAPARRSVLSRSSVAASIPAAASG
jgi:hypothetical protein